MKTTFVIFLGTLTLVLQALAEVMGGVGAVLVKRDGDTDVRITHVIEKSPAANAGIQPECFLVSVDGAAMHGKTIAECAALIRGPAGSKVSLELTDVARTKTNKVTLTRGEIQINIPVRSSP